MQRVDTKFLPRHEILVPYRMWRRETQRQASRAAGMDDHKLSQKWRVSTHQTIFFGQGKEICVLVLNHDRLVLHIQKPNATHDIID